MRQTGRTTQQIIKAPQNAVYVWVSHNLAYPKRIAEVYKRTDLLITGPQWITQERWRGGRYSGIILDHAVSFNPDEWGQYQEALTRIGL